MKPPYNKVSYAEKTNATLVLKVIIRNNTELPGDTWTFFSNLKQEMGFFQCNVGDIHHPNKQQQLRLATSSGKGRSTPTPSPWCCLTLNKV